MLRGLATAMIALLVSAFAGSMAAVAIAEYVRAQEEFILVFMGVPIVALITTIALLIAGALGRLGAGAFVLLVLVILLTVAAFVASLYTQGTFAATARDTPIIAGFAIPSVVVIAAQWLVLRLRARRVAPPPPRFGRMAAPH